MIAGRASRTVERPALLRAAHQVLDDEPKILHDPRAVGLIEGTSRADIMDQAASLRSPGLRLVRSAIVLRARYAEDRLAAAASDGVEQYVILGAGLDTFAFRQPPWAARLRVFELDHPGTQAAKAAVLRRRGMRAPANVSYVPIDFAAQSPAVPLLGSGFDPQKPAFFSLVGVMQYLTAQAIDALFSYVARLPSGSGIAFSFNPPEDELDVRELEEARAAAIRSACFGEPWLSRPRAEWLARRLRTLGFREVEHLAPEAAARVYFDGRHDGLRAPRFEQVMSAIL